MPHVRKPAKVQPPSGGGEAQEPVPSGGDPYTGNVDVVAPDGATVSSIPASQLEDAKVQRYRVATPEESAAANNFKAPASEQGAISPGVRTALASGFLGGQTVNLAKPAILAAGGDTSAMETADAEHPIPHLLGELGGGAALTAEAALLAPGLLGGAAVGGAGWALRSVLTNAALGEAYSMGDHLNEHMLGEAAPTAQKLWHELSFNLLGAGAATLFHGITSSLLDKHIENVTAKADAAKAAFDTAVKTQQPGAIPTASTVDTVSRDMSAKEQDIHDAMEAARHEMYNGGSRAKEIASLSNDVTSGEAQGNTAILFAKSQPILEAARAQGKLVDQGMVDEAEKIIAGAADRAGKSESSAETYMDLEGKTKKQLSDLLQMNTKSSDEVVQRTKNILYAIEQERKANVTNPEYWGRGAVATSELNSAENAYHVANENYLPLVADKKAAVGHYQDQWVMNPAKNKALLEGLATGDIKADPLIQSRIAVEQARRDLVDVIARVNRNADAPFDETHLTSLFDKASELRDQGVPLAMPQVPVQQTTRGKIVSALAQAAGYKGGAALGSAFGVPGLAAGMIGGRFAKMAANAMLNREGAVVASTTLGQQAVLARMNMMQARTDQAISSGVRAFLHGAAGGIPAATGSKFNKPLTPGEASRAPTPILRRVNEIRAMADPATLEGRLTNATSRLAATAPTISAQLQSTATRAVQYLHGLIPPQLNGDVLPDKSETISATQEYNLAQVYPIVKKPVSILSHMAAGTLEPLMVDAMKQVFPDLYTEIRDRIGNSLLNNPKQLGIGQMSMLSMFLGVPVKSSFGPDFAQWVQVAAATAPAEQSAVNLGALKGEGKPNSQVAPLTKSLSLEASAFPRSA